MSNNRQEKDDTEVIVQRRIEQIKNETNGFAVPYLDNVLRNSQGKMLERAAELRLRDARAMLRGSFFKTPFKPSEGKFLDSFKDPLINPLARLVLELKVIVGTIAAALQHASTLIQYLLAFDWDNAADSALKFGTTILTGLMDVTATVVDTLIMAGAFVSRGIFTVIELLDCSSKGNNSEIAMEESPNEESISNSNF